MKGIWVPSQMGTNLLKDPDGFRYRKFREIKSGITYRCNKKDSLGCPAVALIDKCTITDCLVDILETYNSTWTDTLERRPSLYSVIEGFIRKVNFVMKRKINSCYL